MGCKNQSRKNVILTRVSPGVAESLLFRNVNLIRGGSWIVKIEVVKMLFLLVYPQGLSKAYLLRSNNSDSWGVMDCKNRICKNVILTHASPRVVESLFV